MARRKDGRPKTIARVTTPFSPAAAEGLGRFDAAQPSSGTTTTPAAAERHHD